MPAVRVRSSAYSFGDTINLTQANINGVSNESGGEWASFRNGAGGVLSAQCIRTVRHARKRPASGASMASAPIQRPNRRIRRGPRRSITCSGAGLGIFPRSFCRSDYRTAAMAGYVYFGFRVVCEVAKEGSG